METDVTPWRCRNAAKRHEVIATRDLFGPPGTMKSEPAGASAALPSEFQRPVRLAGKSELWIFGVPHFRVESVHLPLDRVVLCGSETGQQGPYDRRAPWNLRGKEELAARQRIDPFSSFSGLSAHSLKLAGATYPVKPVDPSANCHKQCPHCPKPLCCVLLAVQPDSVCRAFDTLAAPAVALATLHTWRQSNYLADRPGLPSEDTLREHCAVALDIAALAADQCRHHGIPGTEFARWDQQVRRVTDVLDGPIRLSKSAARL